MDKSSFISHAVQKIHDSKSEFFSFLNVVICVVIENNLKFLDDSSEQDIGIRHENVLFFAGKPL